MPALIGLAQLTTALNNLGLPTQRITVRKWCKKNPSLGARRVGKRWVIPIERAADFLGVSVEKLEQACQQNDAANKPR